MDCTYCNSKLVKRKGEVEFKSRSLGKVMVPNLQFLECDNCGEKLINPEEGEKAISYIEKEEQIAINSLPIGEFVTSKEAAEILGITKQAFSKNHKIKQGVIYSAEIGWKKYYYKKSVELFKEKGNGKFLLPKQELYLDYNEITVREQQKPKYTKVFVAAIPKTSDVFIESDVMSAGWMFPHQTEKRGIKNACH